MYTSNKRRFNVTDDVAGYNRHLAALNNMEAVLLPDMVTPRDVDLYEQTSTHVLTASDSHSIFLSGRIKNVYTIIDSTGQYIESGRIIAGDRYETDTSNQYIQIWSGWGNEFRITGYRVKITHNGLLNDCSVYQPNLENPWFYSEPAPNDTGDCSFFPVGGYIPDWNPNVPSGQYVYMLPKNFDIQRWDYRATLNTPTLFGTVWRHIHDKKLKEYHINPVVFKIGGNGTPVTYTFEITIRYETIGGVDHDESRKYQPELVTDYLKFLNEQPYSY